MIFLFTGVFASAFAAPMESNNLVLAAIREIGNRFEALEVRFGAMEVRFGAMEVRFGALEARFGALGARFGAFEAHSDARFDALEEALVIPAVAARLERCAASAVLFFLISAGSGGTFKQCSAVPLPLELLGRAAAAAPPAASSFFFTSAHCFFNETTKKLIATQATLFMSGAEYRCVLREHSPELLDIAILYCALPVPVPPTRLSTLDYAAQLPVALLGFSEGRHVDPLLWGVVVGSNYSNRSISYARHVRNTRLTNSLQLPQDASASAAAGVFGANGELLLQRAQPVSAVGFIDDKPELGMSGGAVVDTRCGVLGVTELQSVHGRGGQFVRLTPFVLEWAAAVAAGAAAA